MRPLRYRSATAYWVWPLATAVHVLATGDALAQDQDTVVLDTVVLEAQGMDVQDGGNGYTAGATGTGVKSGALITEVPQSISVVTQQEIKDRAPLQFEDAVAYSAGVTSSIWGVDDRFDQFLIRGFDSANSGTFRDGLNQKTLDFSGFKIDPFMIQRIDVLRGPAGVVYGENDAGGMANVITKRPQFQPGTQTFLSYGTNNVARAGLDMTGPLGQSGDLAYRLIVLGQSGEGEPRNSDNDRLLLAPSLTWQVSGDTRITVMAQWQKDKLAPNVFLPVAGEDYPLSLGPLPDDFIGVEPDFNRLWTRQNTLGYEVEHQVNDGLLLRQNFRYARQNTSYRHLYYSNVVNGTTMTFPAFTVEEVARQIRLDTQMQYDIKSGNSSSTLLAGIDYSRDELDGANGFASYSIPIADPDYDFDVPLPPLFSDQKQVITSKALYAQGVTRFDSGLTLTYGARKAWVESRLVNYLAGNVVTDGKNDAFTKMLGATWDLGQGWVPYASYTEGFTTNIGTDINGNPFVPTASKQYEIGVKYAPNDHSTYTIALFDLRKENVLTSAQDAGNPFGQVQTGQVRHKGIELEARTALANGLSLVGGYTYLDAEITRSNDGDQGNAPSLVPRHQASLWVDYDFGKTRPNGALAGFSVGGGVRYVAENWADNANTRLVGDYTVADLALRYDFDDYAVRLNVSNLLDRKYYATCTPYLGGCILGAGRNVSLSLDRSF